MGAVRGLLTLGLLLLLIAGPIGQAHVPEGASFSKTFIVTAYERETENGTVAWFMVDNRTMANPTLKALPGESILFIFVNQGETNHTLALDGAVQNRTEPVPPGQEHYLWFRVPEEASGQITYMDPDWRHRGMQATIEIQGDQVPTSQVPAGPAGSLVATVGLLALSAWVGREPNPSASAEDR